MPRFIWAAKDNLGKPIVRELVAKTIEESKAILLAEGCTDLELKSDEIMDIARAQFDTNDAGDDMPAKDWLKSRDKPPPTFLNIMFRSVVDFKGLYLILILLLVFNLYLGYKIPAIVTAAILIAGPFFYTWLALPGIYYEKLNKAKDWHRWEEVLKLVGVLEKIRYVHFIKLPKNELIRYRAQALAGLGRLTEALAVFQQCENQPKLPSWLYKAQLAGIYDIAGEHDKSLEYAWSALEEKRQPIICLDLAYRLLHYKKDTIQAHKLLAEVDKSVLVDYAESFYLQSLGMLSYLEGDYTSAKSNLEKSLEIIDQFKYLPFRDGIINTLKGYLCCVLAKRGDLAQARKYFMQSKKYLVAAKETVLLEECKRAIGYFEQN